MIAAALAPTGCLMAFLSLWTGSLWGRPTWGAYWVWDARLTSALILFFFYLGYIALQNAIPDWRRADKACAVIGVVGVINVPIVYFSVQWWNTLHQGASITSSGSSIHPMMLTALLLMVAGFWLYTFAVTFGSSSLDYFGAGIKTSHGLRNSQLKENSDGTVGKHFSLYLHGRLRTICLGQLRHGFILFYL